ncbi:MAG: MFS transporter [Dehalococcoidia bacterium]|nr:MFS transporter [Dehalococcoidia bacterium]
MSFWTRTFEALSERDFAWYFAGNSAFFLAMQMNIIARGYLAFDLTDSAAALGLVSVAFAIPMMLVAPVAGVVSDRVNKKHLLMVTQTGSGAVNLVIALLILSGLIQFWHLVAAAVLTGTIMAMVMPARQAIIPQLVPQQMMMNAISLQMGGMNLTRIIGPALGGLLIAPLGVGGVYLITVGLFAVGILSIVPLPSHGMVSTENTEPKRFVEDLVGGFQFIGRNPLFRLLITAALVMPLFAFPVQQILPVFAEKVYGGIFSDSAVALGLMMSATGVGGLIGAVFSANIGNYPHKGRLMMTGSAVMTVCFAGFASTSLWLSVSPAFVMAVLLLVLGNVGAMLFQVTNNTVIQARVPDEYRGRVMSVMMMSFGTMPLGVVPVTLAADAWGAPAAIIGAQAVGLATVGLIFGLSGQLRGLRLDNLQRAEMSPAQAAVLVAQGKITREEADRLSGRTTTAPALAVHPPSKAHEQRDTREARDHAAG